LEYVIRFQIDPFNGIIQLVGIHRVM
jgi:hypothetical protein